MRHVLAAAACVLLTPGLTFAHFLWLDLKPAGDGTKVLVYFGEEAQPDDPALLSKVEAAEGWVIRGRDDKEALKFQIGADALEATVDEAVQGPIVLRHTYGVISRGGESSLLQYYAKTYPSVLPGTWSQAKDDEHLPLEVTPELQHGKLSLLVTWQQKPLADAAVVVAGPGLESNLEGVTDAEGRFAFEPTQGGTFSIRARRVDPTPGTQGEQKYDSIKSYSTLTLKYEPAVITPQANNLPDLPRGVASFGAAIAGDVLYVYGGNYGSAHAYSNADQSNDVWSLNLAQEGSWKQVTTGPKMQGLALVAHAGRVYRIGGFTAVNNEDEDAKLFSQPDFARLSADGQQWEPIAPLPVGRSSHDAAVIGDTLYVVGGWHMNGDSDDAKWHDTLLTFDLTKPDGQWVEASKTPFQRRAVSAAAWNGRLAVVGGMTEDGEITNEIALYDPANGAWSTGPKLQGGAMDGFGTSAFAAGDQLVVTTMCGSIQGLRPGQTEWQYLGQLDHPRFFHRLTSRSDDEIVIVGGTSMQSGKVLPLEVLKFTAQPSVAAQ